MFTTELIKDGQVIGEVKTVCLLREGTIVRTSTGTYRVEKILRSIGDFPHRPHCWLSVSVTDSK